MTISKPMMANLLIAGALLGMPGAFAADQTVASVPNEQSCKKISFKGAARHEGFAERLGLSDQQLEQIGQLKDQYRTRSAEKIAEVRTAHHQMAQLLTSPTIDKQAIASLNDKINSIKNELSNLRVNYAISKAEVFTPEQRKEMNHHILVMESMGGGRHFRHGGGRA